MDQSSLERIYNGYAKVYDRVFGGVFDASRARAVRQLAVQPGERVLEVGVGTGVALPLYPHEASIVGIDYSEGMLEQARQRVERHGLRNVELRRMDAMQMDFPDSSFDAVIAAYVVTAVPDYRRVMSEIVRVCRGGGRFVMVSHFKNRNPAIAGVECLINPITQKLGWRTELPLATALSGTPLEVRHAEKVAPFRLWDLVECVNRKSVEDPSAGQAAAHAAVPA